MIEGGGLAPPPIFMLFKEERFPSVANSISTLLESVGVYTTKIEPLINVQTPRIEEELLEEMIRGNCVLKVSVEGVLGSLFWNEVNDLEIDSDYGVEDVVAMYYFLKEVDETEYSEG